MSRIPFNQVIFENVQFNCIDGCNTTNEEKFQALIDKICVDYSKVNLNCLNEAKKESVLEILNLLVLELCNLKSKVNGQGTNNSGSNGTNGASIDISKISLCGRDNSSYTYIDCLEVLSTCFPTLTIEAIISAIIKRLNANSFWIQQIHLLQQQHGSEILTLTTRLNQLENRLNNCCGN